MSITDSASIPSPADEGRRLIGHALVNCSGLLISAVVGVALVPLMIRDLGRPLYGLWIAMESAAAMLARVDLGLTWAVTREVAAKSRDGYDHNSRSFVWVAGTLSVALGLAGWLCMAVLGGMIGAALGVSRQTSSLLFAAGGAVFLFENIRTFAVSILSGIRRFDVVNAVVAAAAILWGAGASVLLLSGCGLITLVIWQALSSAGAAAIALLAVRWRVAELSFRFVWPKLEILRAHVRFSLASQLVAVTGGAIWEIPPFVIGVVLGSRQIVPYYVGRMFPSAASSVAWRSAEVLFPAAGESARGSDHSAAASVLDTGTRLILLAMLPICVVLWVCAPGLLKAWVGSSSAPAVTVLRILLVAEMFDAAALGSSTVLWGLGAARTLLVVDLAMVAAAIALCPPMVVWLGVPGAATALLFTIAVGSVVYIAIASRRCGTTPIGLLRGTSDGLGLPVAACCATALLMNWLAPPNSVPGLVAMPVASASVYFAALQLHGARPAEAEIFSSVNTFSKRFARSLAGY